MSIYPYFDPECNTENQYDYGHPWCMLSTKPSFVSSPMSSLIISNSSYSANLPPSFINKTSNTGSTGPLIGSSVLQPIQDPYLITGIELFLNKDNQISRFSGIYFTHPSELTNPDKWYAVNEGINTIEVKESRRYDILFNDRLMLGNSVIQFDGKRILFKGRFPDSCLCGFAYSQSSIGIVNSCVFIFRRFSELNFPEEYISYNLENGLTSITASQFNSRIWKDKYISPKGSFINQLIVSFNSIDVIDSSFDPLTAALNKIPNKKRYVVNTSLGWTGIGGVGINNFNLPNGLYTWQMNADKCCSMDPDTQYDKDSIEGNFCQLQNLIGGKNPKSLCRSYLSTGCSSSDNLSSTNCSNFCELSDVNCDDSIRSYCQKYKKLNTEGIMVYDISEMLKDKVCACFVDTTSNNVKSILSDYPSSLQLAIQQNLKDGLSISNPIRMECTSPECVSSTYKSYQQKQNLASIPCTNTETCFGNGFIFPRLTNNSTEVECNKYINTDNCFQPLQPSIFLFPDPFDSSCKNISKNNLPVMITEPSYCKLSPNEVEDGCEDGFVKYSFPVVVPSNPPNDPNLCPPPGEELYYISNIPCDNVRSEPSIPIWKNKLVQFTFLFVLILLLIIIFLKK